MTLQRCNSDDIPEPSQTSSFCLKQSILFKTSTIKQKTLHQTLEAVSCGGQDVCSQITRHLLMSWIAVGQKTQRKTEDDDTLYEQHPIISLPLSLYLYLYLCRLDSWRRRWWPEWTCNMPQWWQNTSSEKEEDALQTTSFSLLLSWKV